MLSLCTFWEFCESVIFFKASITITNWHQDLRGGLLHLNLNTSKRVVPSCPGESWSHFSKWNRASGFGLRASGFGLPIISLVNLWGIYLCLPFYLLYKIRVSNLCFPFISFVNLRGIYLCFPILSLVHIRGIIFLFSFCISCKSSGYLSLLSIVHIWGIKSLLSYCISGKSWSFH